MVLFNVAGRGGKVSLVINELKTLVMVMKEGLKW